MVGSLALAILLKIPLVLDADELALDTFTQAPIPESVEVIDDVLDNLDRKCLT